MLIMMCSEKGLILMADLCPANSPSFKKGIDLKATNKETIDRVFTVT